MKTQGIAREDLHPMIRVPGQGRVVTLALLEEMAVQWGHWAPDIGEEGEGG